MLVRPSVSPSFNTSVQHACYSLINVMLEMSFTAVVSPVHPQAVRATRPLILIAVQASSTNSTVDDDDDEIC